MNTTGTAMRVGAGPATVTGRFSGVVAATPAATAVVFGGERLSYAALDTRSARLAARLAAAGVGRGDAVGVLGERCAELVVALLAILKAGGAYVALDPAQPPRRLAALVADVRTRLLLTDAVHAHLVPQGVPALAIGTGSVDGVGDPVPGPAGPEAIAYVAYTSGSTGGPKGVCVPHRAVHRLVVGADFAPLGPGDVVLQYAPVAFDASTWEIWGPLLNGATLVVAPPGRLSPRDLVHLLRQAGVTACWLTAGLFAQVVDEDLAGLTNLRYLLAGGDVLSPSHVDKATAALPGARVVNGYGPTENTTFTCCHTVDEHPVGPRVPIGRAINGTVTYVLDAGLAPVEAGRVGRLYAAGAGLAHGYLRRPALTAERFLPDPYGGGGGRMYDTGDLVIAQPDGVLEFVGRADAQVKVRGYRVEPGEAEAALAGLPGIRQAAVIGQPATSGGHRLVAFFESDLPVPATELRRSLADVLPSYLVPERFTRVDALPLTPIGKVDRAALAARVGRTRPGVSSPHRQADGPVQARLTLIWQEALEMDGVGVDDDFFELGGHSLLATAITAEIAAEFGVYISARAFYENPTIAELAAEVSARLPAGEPR